MVFNTTAYHPDTPNEVKDVLDRARGNGQRIYIWYGKDGQSWNEESGTIGYVGRSTGTEKVPLLIHNKRSFGGPHMLDHCIIKITDAKTKRVLYQHPKFKQDHFAADDTLVYKDLPGANEEIYANCRTTEQAARLAAFMNGERNSK